MWQGSARTLRHFCSLHKGTMTNEDGVSQFGDAEQPAALLASSEPCMGGVEGEAEADPWLSEEGRNGVLGGGGVRRELSVAKRDGRLTTLAGLAGVEVMVGDGGLAGVGDKELVGAGWPMGSANCMMMPPLAIKADGTSARLSTQACNKENDRLMVVS
ncbi:hypothetical protein HaLaN_16042 [Haematococcus lacustris]|uniref:Uncharacterized protein n=1 Tax=Haematococcus lacustris TaxID=44745 RepID=A0A699ZCI8_HAELA|nr:hypothetical protein HaLaN_16042 [Haematococcus lacustris]